MEILRDVSIEKSGIGDRIEGRPRGHSTEKQERHANLRKQLVTGLLLESAQRI